MTGRYRYWTDAAGVRWCYAIEPTYTCPSPALAAIAEEDPLAVDPRVLQAADLLGVSPAKLGAWLRRGSHARARDAQTERLLDTCDTCGARMRRLGFRTWAEREPTSEEAAEQGPALFGPRPVIVRDSIYHATKREARTWAYEGSQTP